MDLLTELAILVLAAFVGFQVISKVPKTLHTPLMSGTNAIHGIVLLGGLVAIANAEGILSHVLLVIAIAFGTINIVGGFLVTDRMLGMFKRKEPAVVSPDEDGDEEQDAGGGSPDAQAPTAEVEPSAEQEPPAGDEQEPPAGDEQEPPAGDEQEPPAGDEPEAAPEHGRTAEDDRRDSA